MKKWVLSSLLLLLAAGSLRAEPVSPGPSCDTVFWWLAGGISSARIQRLISPDATRVVSCSASTQCRHTLQKAGADAGLIASLQQQDAKLTLKRNGAGPNAARKTDGDSSCTNSGTAAQIAILVHEKNLNAAQDKLRAWLRPDAETPVPAVTLNGALLHFVL